MRHNQFSKINFFPSLNLSLNAALLGGLPNYKGNTPHIILYLRPLIIFFLTFSVMHCYFVFLFSCYFALSSSRKGYQGQAIHSYLFQVPSMETKT